MALDRHNIEKKDFPLGQRGYDPDAVDAHLSALADEIAAFKEEARRRSETVAASASERVRTIVEAAEQSAADITRAAEEEARGIREEASNEANSTREHATREAREYLDKVSGSTNAMLERLSAMEQEMNAMVETVRAGSSRLTGDLEQIQGNLGEVSSAVAPRPAFVPDAPSGEGERDAPAAPQAADAMTSPPTETLTPQWSASHDAQPGELQEPQFTARFGADPVPAEPFAQTAADADAPPAAEADTSPAPEAAELHSVAGEPAGAHGNGFDEPHAPSGGDAEGARLIALNMALNGTPREETARYLSENFHISDSGGLLDEVYASVES